MKSQPFQELRARLPVERKEAELVELKPKPERLPELSNEQELLDWAMREVRPIQRRVEQIVGKPPARPEIVDDDKLAYSELKALVEGKLQFHLSNGDEYMEGAVDGLDSRILHKLRGGKFAIQEILDLHRMRRPDAKAALLRFIERCGSADRRSLLVVHGRGLNSKDQIPVLKESVALWLTRGRLARWTLCFCTARSCDGGAGAVYVLLRARPASK